MAYVAPALSGPGAEPERLSIDVIRRRLAGGLVGGHIYLFARLVSATDVLGRLAETGARDGTVVVAEDGTDLRVAVLFRLAGALGEAPVLSSLAGQAVGEALQHAPLPAAARIECVAVACRTGWAIVGVGVNVATIPEGARPRIDRNAFAAAFLNAVDRLFTAYAAGSLVP